MTIAPEIPKLPDAQDNPDHHNPNNIEPIKKRISQIGAQNGQETSRIYTWCKSSPVTNIWPVLTLSDAFVLKRHIPAPHRRSPDHAEAQAFQVDVQVHDAAALHLPHPLQPQVHLHANDRGRQTTASMSDPAPRHANHSGSPADLHGKEKNNSHS